MPADYEIDATRQTHRVGTDGSLVDVMEVSFHLEPEELTSAVRVDYAPGWETAAKAKIVEQVAALRSLYSP